MKKKKRKREWEREKENECGEEKNNEVERQQQRKENDFKSLVIHLFHSFTINISNRTSMNVFINVILLQTIS
jgi:hypothetical protein